MGSRLTDADALEMYHELSIHELGRLAFARTQELHPEPYRTYVVDRNINYSNVCTAKCIFCNFKADPGDPDAYILTFEQIGRKIEELLDIGGTQILMQGGLVPAPDGWSRSPADPDGAGQRPALQKDALPFEWYLDLLRFIRRNYPTIHIHAFSPPEIWAFHQVFRMPLRDVLLRLQEAGLATIPGGGGEILVDRVRRRIGQGKTLTAEWLEVMRQAHKLGMKTSCTMMMGHIETIEERIEHLRVLRELQDETGGFTAFIHWPFQPEGAPLGRWPMLPSTGPSREPFVGPVSDRSFPTVGPVSDRSLPTVRPVSDRSLPTVGPVSDRSLRDSSVALDELRGTSGENEAEAASPSASQFAGRRPPFRRPRPDGAHLLLADAHEYLVMLALARLYLDNIPNMQSSWVTMGPKVGQLALFYGANDMGSVMMEENVVSQAGATFRLSEAEIRRLIADAGWIPQQRDQYYRPVDTSEQRRSRALRSFPDRRREPLGVVPLTVASAAPGERAERRVY